MRVVCLLFQEAAPLAEIAEACYRWTPQIAIRENEAIFLEIEQCKKLYKEETLLLRLQACLRRFGARARISISRDAALSLALARRPSFAARPYELPLEALHDVASPFKKDPEMERQTEVLIGILRKLGLGTLEEFANLPPRGLSSRFSFLGVELHRLLGAGRSGHQEFSGASSWPVFVPPQKISEHINLHDHDNCQNIEPLLFVLKNLVSRAMARLAGRGERVTALELEFELEKYSTIQNPRRCWPFRLPLPQGSVAGLFPLIQEKLQGDLSRVPLLSPVTGIGLRILETVPGKLAQRNFFSRKEEEQEAWNSLMARLCQRLGREHTFVASPVESYRPEKAWRRNWAEIQEAEKNPLEGIDLPFPERPLRLLKQPLPLFKVHNALVHRSESRGPEAFAEKRWEIQDWEGPERLNGEWWGEELKRDYFRVGTFGGEQLWIFRIPETDRIYLHGFFD